MKLSQASWPLILVLFSFGCGQNRTKKTDVVHHPPVSSCEARLVDVPFPLDTVLKDMGLCDMNGDDTKTQSESAQSTVSFITTLSRDQLKTFYNREMERLGWKELSNIDATDESLVLYEKPFRFCIISLRISKNRQSKNFVTIFMSAK